MSDEDERNARLMEMLRGYIKEEVAAVVAALDTVEARLGCTHHDDNTGIARAVVPHATVSEHNGFK